MRGNGRPRCSLHTEKRLRYTLKDVFASDPTARLSSNGNFLFGKPKLLVLITALFLLYYTVFFGKSQQFYIKFLGQFHQTISFPDRSFRISGIKIKLNPLDLVNRGLRVDLSDIVECLAALNAVRLGLRLKANSSVLYALYAAAEIRLAAKEIGCVNLNTGLIGIKSHLKPA